MNYAYGVRKGGQLVRCFTNHAEAVAFAADILENWWGSLEVEWYPYTPRGWESV